MLDAGVDKRAIDVIEPTPPEASSRALIYNNLAIIAVDYIPHNVPNCAYHIFMNHEKLFYATDCSTLEGVKAKGYDYYLVEANHTKADIEARIAAKLEAGEFAYELEAMRNHLSEEQAIAWLAENAGPNSKYQFLHQHRAK